MDWLIINQLKLENFNLNFYKKNKIHWRFSWGVF